MQLLHAALLTPTGRSTHGSGFLFFREETGSRDLLTGQGDQMRFLGRNVPRLWTPGAAISKCRDLILLAMTTVPGDAGLRTRSFGRMTEGAHRVCLDSSSQGVGSGPGGGTSLVQEGGRCVLGEGLVPVPSSPRSPPRVPPHQRCCAHTWG